MQHPRAVDLLGVHLQPGVSQELRVEDRRLPRARESLQGKRVLSSFDVAREAGGAKRGVVKTFSVSGAQELTIELTPKSKLQAVLSGIEISPR